MPARAVRPVGAAVRQRRDSWECGAAVSRRALAEFGGAEASKSFEQEQKEQEQEEQEQEEQEQEQEQEPAGKGEVRVYAGLCWFSTVFVLFSCCFCAKSDENAKGRGQQMAIAYSAAEVIHPRI